MSQWTSTGSILAEFSYTFGQQGHFNTKIYSLIVIVKNLKEKVLCAIKEGILFVLGTFLLL